MSDDEKRLIRAALMSWLAQDNPVYTPHMDEAIGRMGRELSDHEILALADKVWMLP